MPLIVGGVSHSDEGNQDHLPQTTPQVNLIYSGLYGDSLESLDSVKLTNKADHYTTWVVYIILSLSRLTECAI